MAECQICRREVSNSEIAFVPFNAMPHEEPPNLVASLFGIGNAFKFFTYHEKCLVEHHTKFLDEYFANKESRPKKERLEFWIFRKYSSLMDMLLLRGFVYLLVGLFLAFGGVYILFSGGASLLQSIFAVAGVLGGIYVLGRGIPSLNVFLMNLFYRLKGSEK
ncbi:hypothetical protein H0O01_02545 [Candidatus Micrarchaeota archaeon]|nr:hypothetical protein [Candidatus Micrarchaeota archaeon]